MNDGDAATADYTQFRELVRLRTELRQALIENARLKQRLEAENLCLQEATASSPGFSDIVGESEGLRRVFHKVSSYARAMGTRLSA